MLTALPREELVALGADKPLVPLVDQARHTLELASAEGGTLAALLAPGYLDELARTVEAVAAAGCGLEAVRLLEERTEALDAGRAARGLAIWRRQVAQRARRMRHLGTPVPEGLTRLSGGRNLDELLERAERSAAMFAQNLARLGGEEARPLLERGRRLAAELRRVRAAFPEVPPVPEVEDHLARKGALYVALKVVGAAAAELHADDPVAAARYHLGLLHRPAAPDARS